MTSINMMPAIIKRAVRTQVNVHFTGNPGIGKTSIIEQTVEEIRKKDKEFKLWCMYTPAMTPLDFSAVVPNIKEKSLNTMHNDRLPNAYDDPEQRGILFLGESWNADQDTNKCLQKYVNNEDMGGLRKPLGVIVVSDSNDIGHKSGVVNQSLALLSRSRLISVHCDKSSTLKHFEARSVDSSIMAFLTARPELIDNFERILESRTHSTWANPRSWMRLSTSLKDAEDCKETLTEEEIIGDVGESAGREFIAFRYAMRNLVRYEDIVDDPKEAEVPEKISDKYAVMAMLAESAKFKDFGKVSVYVDRYDQELQVLYMKLIHKSRNPDTHKITNSRDFIEWIKTKPELIEIIARSK